jgi:hypothetical protein
MPRHFAKRMYGPYFLYDHSHGKCPKDAKCNVCSKKKENLIKKIIKKISASRA